MRKCFNSVQSPVLVEHPNRSSHFSSELFQRRKTHPRNGGLFRLGKTSKSSGLRSYDYKPGGRAVFRRWSVHGCVGLHYFAKSTHRFTTFLDILYGFFGDCALVVVLVGKGLPFSTVGYKFCLLLTNLDFSKRCTETTFRVWSHVSRFHQLRWCDWRRFYLLNYWNPTKRTGLVIFSNFRHFLFRRILLLYDINVFLRLHFTNWCFEQLFPLPAISVRAPNALLLGQPS